MYLITQLEKHLGKSHYSNHFPLLLTIEKTICCNEAKVQPGMVIQRTFHCREAARQRMLTFHTHGWAWALAFRHLWHMRVPSGWHQFPPTEAVSSVQSQWKWPGSACERHINDSKMSTGEHRAGTAKGTLKMSRYQACVVIRTAWSWPADWQIDVERQTQSYPFQAWMEMECGCDGTEIPQESIGDWERKDSGQVPTLPRISALLGIPGLASIGY